MVGTGLTQRVPRAGAARDRRRSRYAADEGVRRRVPIASALRWAEVDLGAVAVQPSTAVSASNTGRGTDDAPAPVQGAGRYVMRKTMMMIAALIGVLLMLLVVASSADAATAVEYGLIAAP